MLAIDQKKTLSKIKINPAQFISKKDVATKKIIGAKKSQKKIIKSEKRYQKRYQKSKQQTKPLPAAKANKNDLPKATDNFLDQFSSLPEAVEAKKKLTPQEAMLKEVYGSDINKLSIKAKKYLLDNHLRMQIITQKVLNRIGRIYIDLRFNYYTTNYVEFTLFPDGHISDIKLLKDAGFNLLDKITKETIEIAYKDYPRPSEPILVRYKFLYDLRSY